MELDGDDLFCLAFGGEDAAVDELTRRAVAAKPLPTRLEQVRELPPF